MPNRRDFDHIGSFNFKVEISGVTNSLFIFVSGIESQSEVIEYRNGADNLTRKIPGRTSYSNIVMRRGFTNADELWRWRKSVTDGVLERKNGSIIILGADAETEIIRFNFFQAWPCRYELGQFNGEVDSVLIEEIEIVTEKIERG
jgi:phage tail-like protein